MLKEEFLSIVEVAPKLKLRYFTEKKRPHVLEETSLRIKAFGGAIPNIPIYEVHRFLSVNETLTKQFLRRDFIYSDAYGIFREGINKADYAAKTGRLL